MGHQSHSVTAQRWLGSRGSPDLFVMPVSALSTCGFQILGAFVRVCRGKEIHFALDYNFTPRFLVCFLPYREPNLVDLISPLTEFVWQVQILPAKHNNLLGDVLLSHTVSHHTF